MHVESETLQLTTTKDEDEAGLQVFFLMHVVEAKQFLQTRKQDKA
jgi:hypothetical protein